MDDKHLTPVEERRKKRAMAMGEMVGAAIAYVFCAALLTLLVFCTIKFITWIF